MMSAVSVEIVRADLLAHEDSEAVGCTASRES